MNCGLAATAGLGLPAAQASACPTPARRELTPTGAQLLADHFLTHAAMNHPYSLAAGAETVFISCHCLENYQGVPVVARPLPRAWVTAEGQGTHVVRNRTIGTNSRNVAVHTARNGMV